MSDAADNVSVDEYEREPVPRKAQMGFGSFLGQYAGEHTAGTELMIGPLFIAAGVAAFDVVVGLIVGNLLAVLSWRYLTAPIAVKARLTLYYHLEQICGRKLVTLYNLANGIMFCFLAGSMITVSATAVGVWFDFPMPGLNDTYPNSSGWVVAVLAVGLVISLVAARGYNMVAKFANIAAPWMVLIFLGFGLVGLRAFLGETNTTVQSIGDLWHLADTVIWKGGEPLGSQAKFTFWHVMFFAWFCNMAMHIGMSDLTVFRYAKKAKHAWATATGMYVGHFMAWLCASILYALQLHRDPSNTDVLPGPMAADALGLAGLICVIVAGWTTANPTIYRAGLAFQAILPTVSRFRVTFVTGLLATVAAMFPAIAMKLLGFVALYGLVLMPMGAIVVMDWYVLPRLGLRRFFAKRTGSGFNIAACAAWLVTLGLCVGLVKSGHPAFQIFFVSLPGWFIASLLYVGLSWMLQRKANWGQGQVFEPVVGELMAAVPESLATEQAAESAANQGGQASGNGLVVILGILAWAALLATILPSVIHVFGGLDPEKTKTATTAATLVWFVIAPVWLIQKHRKV